MSLPPQENRFYEMVLRMVLRGEPEADVMHRLQVNEVEPEDARRIYAQAFRERVATIRSEHLISIRNGSVAILGAIALFATVAYFTSSRDANGALRFGVSFPTTAMPIIAVLYGSWKIVDGLAGIFTASSKEGPI